MRRHAQRARQAGFSMIEVLAAMVIFGTSAALLFSWIGQTADRLHRLNVEQGQLFAELAALEYMRALNPMQQPDGEVRLGDTLVRWQAAPVGTEERARGPGATEGAYMVQLYRVRLTTRSATAPGTPAANERSLYLAGWRQTHETRRELPFALDPK